MRLRPSLFILFGLLAAFPDHSPAATPGQARSPLSISFRDQTFVDGENIRFGDVARIIAGDDGAVAMLENLEVAKSAGFGLTRMLDTEDLYNRFLKRHETRYSIEYERKTLRVTTRAGRLSRDSLARMVDAFIASQPSAQGEIRRWEITRMPQEIMIPLGPHRLEMGFSGARRKGKVDLNLAVRNESRTLRNIPLTINLRVEEPVLVAKKQIARDAILSGDNASVEMRETTLLSDAAVMDPEKMIGLLARTTIVPGRIITPRMVAMVPTVRRGQEAKIIYRTAGVSVTADAVCRQDGMTGQIITAKSLVSQRLVRVRVLKDGFLEPVPGG